MFQNPFDARWPEMEAAIELIRDHRVVAGDESSHVLLYPVAAGCSFGLPGHLGNVPGTSGMLPEAHGSNRMESTRTFVTCEFDKFVCPLVAQGLAAHAFMEMGANMGPGTDLRRILGIGVTGTIATTVPEAGKRGGQQVYAAVHDGEGVWCAGVRFEHSSTFEAEASQRQKRTYQSQLGDLLALSIVLQRLGWDPVPFENSYHIEGVSFGTRCDVARGFYVEPQQVVFSGPKPADDGIIAVGADGNPMDVTALEPRRHVLIPSAVNPITPGHDAMAKVVRTLREDRKLEPVFAITANAEKGEIEWDEVLRRGARLVGRWPFVVFCGQKLSLYINQARLLKKLLGAPLEFAVGGDKPPQLFDPQYCDEFGGPMGAYTTMKALGMRFFVFPRRDTAGTLWDMGMVPTPMRDRNLFHEVQRFTNPWSSTAARNAENGATA